jgi:hypothetical protein
MLIDPASLAVVLQCHEESVRRWIRAGKLTAIQGPGGIRLDLRTLAMPESTRAGLINEWRAALDRAADRAVQK